MSRALDAFQGRPSVVMDDRYLKNLQARLAVLLSNSAASSGVEAPPGWSRWEPPYDDPRTRDNIRWLEYVNWWAKVRDRIQLYDPWLPESIRQRID